VRLHPAKCTSAGEESSAKCTNVSMKLSANECDDRVGGKCSKFRIRDTSVRAAAMRQQTHHLHVDFVGEVVTEEGVLEH
jgi:hypothetical protein